MVPHTRRRFLHVAAAAAGGLAGCSQLTGGAAESTRSATPTASAPPDSTGDAASNTATDPPTLLVRADTTWPPIRVADPDRESPETPERDRISGRIRYDVVDSASRADRLTVADGVDVAVTGTEGNGEASVSAFVAETDFDSETLMLHSARVRECFRLKLCSVSWQSDSVDTDYTQQLRPYDERCAADAYVFESRLIRLPVALDEDEVNSYGSSIGGSGRCDPRGGPRAEGSRGSARSDSTRKGEPTETTAQATDGGEQ